MPVMLELPPAAKLTDLAFTTCTPKIIIAAIDDGLRRRMIRMPLQLWSNCAVNLMMLYDSEAQHMCHVWSNKAEP